ncbi:MAG: hypothetical protein ACI3XI_03945 [Eubacteriales bacterium]
MDWNAIRQDYITDESSSYRKLAQKYGVSYTSIGDKARKEGWAEQREQYLTKTLSKTINAIGNEQAKRAARVVTVADKLLDKIEKAIEGCDGEELIANTQALKHITGALKDIKDIQMIKSDADLREQDARIKKLEMEASVRDEDDDKPSGVVLMPEITGEIKPPTEEESNG